MDALIHLIIILVVLGFVFYLVTKYIPMAAIFKDLLMFVVVIAVLFWVLANYHSWRF